jgi:hypothetical protein
VVHARSRSGMLGVVNLDSLDMPGYGDVSNGGIALLLPLLLLAPVQEGLNTSHVQGGLIQGLTFADSDSEVLSSN